MSTTKVLGTAHYRAVRSPLEGTITLTATGILPCLNYSAQLEMRPERILSPMWNLVFFTQPVCLRAIKPFEISVVMADSGDVIRVMDATGWVEVPVVDPFLPVDFAETQAGKTEYVVYSRLPVTSPPHGCIVVPADALVLAIYYRVFGPASKQECDEWAMRKCGPLAATTAKGGDVPWPVAQEARE